MKRYLLACTCIAAVIGLVGTASAADLPRQMPVKAPAYMAPIYNWTGLYIGINGGGGWGSSTWDGSGARSFDLSGGLIGGTLGYNWQFGTWVVGLEGDADWSNIKGSTNAAGCSGGFTCETENSFLSTIRGRLGYAADRWMPYVTGGVAIGNIKATSPGFAGVDETQVGWTLGGGVEFALAQNWTAKAEYLYVDLGNTACSASCGFVANHVDFTSSIVRGGLNYRF